MKKFLKIFIIVVLIIFAILTINFIRNYIILNKINNAGNDFMNLSNYHITIKEQSHIDNNEISNVFNDIYYKENICVINTYNLNELTEFYWKDFSTGEDLSYYPNTPESEAKFNEDLIKSIKIMNTIKYEKYGYAKMFFSIIAKKDSCYVIENDEIDLKYFFDEKTGFLKKEELQWQLNDENKSVVNSITEYTFESNTVSDENIKKPER